MSSYQVETCAVIGAGNMGSGIAQKMAAEGFPVLLVDVDEARVQKGLSGIRATLEGGVQRKLFRPEQAGEILGRIRGATDWRELAQVDLVVEAVFEDLAVKQDVFRRLGEICHERALLATNTSSFLVADLAAVTARPERVLGLHYFYHPAKNRLVEVIGHAGTAPAAYRAAWIAQEAQGKVAIRSADAPGFVVNRYFVPWLNEAVRLLEEGVADLPTIEWAAKKAFGVAAGPFELMNMTGVPITLHAATTLGQKIHPFYAPAELLRRQVQSGRNWELAGAADESRCDAVAERLLGVVFYVAASLVEEQVGTREETDIGARVGLRWPLGPFELINQSGARRSAALAEAAVARHGLAVPESLRRAPAGGFPLRYVAAGRRGALANVWIQRPATMNALDETVVSQLEGALQQARAAGRDGVVLGASGKAFVAGADVKFFVDQLRKNQFPKIHAFAAHGQRLFQKLSGGTQAVVARVHGQTLGGGCELALACDWIACSPKATFAFPETGIGIFPGLGGTQRLPRRVGYPLAKYLIYTGQALDARSAFKIGLCDRVASFFELDEACEELAGRGPAAPRNAPDEPRDPSWQPVWDYFSRYPVEQILSGRADTGGNPVLDKAVARMQRCSHNALLIAEQLFDQGLDLPLEPAMARELERLQDAFCHPDGLEGLSALLEGRRPVFQKLSLPA